MQTRPLDEIVPEDGAARLRAFRAEVLRLMGGAVEDVVLFGSRARGEAQPDSDYDVAVLLADGVADSWDLGCRLSDMSWEHVVAGVGISAIAIPARSLIPGTSQRTELSARVASEGVPIR